MKSLDKNKKPIISKKSLIVLSLSAVYSAVLYSFGVIYRGPGQGLFNIYTTSIVAAISILVFGIFAGVALTIKDWKDWKTAIKLSFVAAYLNPIIILIGGYFSGLATDLALQRGALGAALGTLGGLNFNVKPMTVQEEIYRNIGNWISNVSFVIFGLTMTVMVYEIIKNYRHSSERH